jgi:hypothetical protein
MLEALPAAADFPQGNVTGSLGKARKLYGPPSEFKFAGRPVRLLLIVDPENWTTSQATMLTQDQPPPPEFKATQRQRDAALHEFGLPFVSRFQAPEELPPAEVEVKVIVA